MIFLSKCNLIKLLGLELIQVDKFKRKKEKERKKKEKRKKIGVFEKASLCAEGRNSKRVKYTRA